MSERSHTQHSNQSPILGGAGAGGLALQRAESGQGAAVAKGRPGGLPGDLRAGLESLSGQDLSDVNVTYNSSRPAGFGAHAVAQGNNIDLGPGQEQHLPHEAWHVVQQREGRVPVTGSMDGTPVNTNPALETEADQMGTKAAQMKTNHSGVALQRQEMPMQFNWERGSDGRLFSTDGSGDYTLSQDDEEAMSEAEHGEIGDADEDGLLLTDPDNKATALEYMSEEMWGAMQAKFKAGVSGPKSFATHNSGQYTGVSYTRNADGAIDFTNPSAQTKWTDPTTDGVVDLTQGTTKAGYGITKGKKLVKIDTKNRSQHFSIADRIAGTSPPRGNTTWHHLVTPYEMIRVDSAVHRKYGHNGGVHLW